MTGIPTLLAWSGGKDCTMALAELRAGRTHRVVALLTTVSPVHDRVSIHGTRRSILLAQAASLGLPLFEAALAPASSNADYDRAWGEAIGRARIELGGVRHVAYGDLFLADVRAYRERQARELGIEPLFPLWGRDTGRLARDFIAGGHEAWLTCVDTTQLEAGFAGRRFDDRLLADLPPAVDPCGERGEFHTCVVAGPGFTRPIPVQPGERVRREGRFEYCDLLPGPYPAPS